MIKSLSLSLFALSICIVPVAAQAQSGMLSSVQAVDFLGPDWMQGPFHTVSAEATRQGNLLVYSIQTPQGEQRVQGTVATRERIREITATETLRQRSTSGTILESAGGRMLNVVGTPVRVVGNLGSKAKDISSVEEGVLFLPKEVVGASGEIINGVGELAVTGHRIVTSAASTKCEGFQCVEKAGEDIWSGFNSLMGKHNSARRLHSEFGTDPQTDNKDLRRQIDRLAYAESYTATTVKLGVSNAGIEYLSPAMAGVGWYNNGEFVGGYEDAHRQRNFEKETYLSWGASPDLVEKLYRSRNFTKIQRRQLFAALQNIEDNAMRLRFLSETGFIEDRVRARILLAQAMDLGALSQNGRVSAYISNADDLLYLDERGHKTALVYADFIDWSESNKKRVASDRAQGVKALRVLGRVSSTFVKEAAHFGISVEQVPH